MRLVIFSVLVASNYAAILNRAYLPPGLHPSNGTYQETQSPFPSGTFQGPTSFHPSQGNFQKTTFNNSPDSNAAILKFANDITDNGFQYSFETANGIHAEESGRTENGARTRGSFSYLGNDGGTYTVVFTADENGFQPQGAHLPVTPPIPAEIQKALEKNAKDEANGIFDDGSYKEELYGERMLFSQSGTNFQASSGVQANPGFPVRVGFQGFTTQQKPSGFQGASNMKSPQGFSSSSGLPSNSGFPFNGGLQGFTTQQKPSGFRAANDFKPSQGFLSGSGFIVDAGFPGSGGFKILTPQQSFSSFQVPSGFKSSLDFISSSGFNAYSGFPGSENFQGSGTQQKFSPHSGYQY